LSRSFDLALCGKDKKTANQRMFPHFVAGNALEGITVIQDGSGEPSHMTFFLAEEIQDLWFVGRSVRGLSLCSLIGQVGAHLHILAAQIFQDFGPLSLVAIGRTPKANEQYQGKNAETAHGPPPSALEV